MAIKVNLTREDILQGKVVSPGWYLCNIKDVTQEQAKSDASSTNTVVSFNIADGPFKDTPLKIWFSEKAPGTIIGFIEALTGKEIQPGVEYDVESAKGKQLRCKVINDEYKGRITNKIDAFKGV
jgi:hypothetical protein